MDKLNMQNIKNGYIFWFLRNIKKIVCLIKQIGE